MPTNPVAPPLPTEPDLTPAAGSCSLAAGASAGPSCGCLPPRPAAAVTSTN